MDSYLAPDLPEYYFNREQVPLLPEYWFISERLTDDEIADFRNAVFIDYWRHGMWPDNYNSMTARTRKAFTDYTLALARYCAAELKLRGSGSDGR